MNPIKTIRKIQRYFHDLQTSVRELGELRDLTLHDATRQAQLAHPNPLNAFGKKCFSQTDEDGITLEILRRMDALGHGTYAEYGVGNGTENNTLILAALGWRGFWVGGETLKPDINQGRGEKFQYARQWITLDNLLPTTINCLQRLQRKTVDVLSLDLDGNDPHFIRLLLESGLRPKLFIAEYNAKFPPPVEFAMPYDAQHVWQSDDYFGASLASLAGLFDRFNYRLVCCNSHTGANAFFIDRAYSSAFEDVPTDLQQLHVGPRYTLYRHYGQPTSTKLIEHLFDRL